MKGLYKIAVLLVFLLILSACEDNTQALKIVGAIAPDKDCEYKYDEKGTFFLTEGLFDLSYNKLANNGTGLYGYVLFLGINNILPEEIKVRGEVNTYVNNVKIYGFDIKVYNPNNIMIYKEYIQEESFVAMNSTSVVPVRIFRDKNAWEGNLGDNSRNVLFLPFTGGKLYDYVTVEIIARAKTLSGETADSDPFNFRINLCIDCLMCPYGYDSDVLCDGVPETLADACGGNLLSRPSCGLAQDRYLTCSSSSEDDGN